MREAGGDRTTFRMRENVEELFGLRRHGTVSCAKDIRILGRVRKRGKIDLVLDVSGTRWVRSRMIAQDRVARFCDHPFVAQKCSESGVTQHVG